MVHKYFQCFRCKYHNHFNNNPNYVKGKCCRRCHTFNYFNYHPRKNNNNHNNYKNNNINNLTARTNKQNYTLPRNTNNTMNSNFIRNENSNGIFLNQIGTSLFNTIKKIHSLLIIIVSFLTVEKKTNLDFLIQRIQIVEIIILI